MQSCWKELEAIHTALSQTSICSIDADNWHQTVSQALTTSSARDSFHCHVAPDMCQHCHQLMAMSAIVTLTLLAKKEKSRKLEEMYLLPLLHGPFLHHSVCLLQHSCQFLRYHVRRALVSILSLPHLKEAPLQYITEACVKMVLHQSAGSPLSLEPLQLLCGMLSRRSAASLSVKMSSLLHPHLAALYKHCCQPVITCELQIKAESSVENSTVTQPNMTDENSVSGKSEVPTFFLEKTAENQLAEENSSVESPLKRVKISTEEKIPFTAHSVTAGTSKSVKQISFKNDAKQKAFSANCSSHDQDLDNMKPSSFVCDNLQREQDTSLNSADPDAHIIGLNASGGGDHLSSQTEMIHYMFLCLLQKVVKLFSSLEETEKSSQLQVFNEMILTRLVSDHTVLFSSSGTGHDSEYLLMKRKFLDILDTVLDYTSIRTSRKVDAVYEQIAVHFVHCFHASNCSWLFLSQHTFIGGCCDKERETSNSGLHSCQHSMVEDTGEKLNWSGDENCSPLLLLLLVTVVFKSCAIVFKTQQKGQAVTVCTTLLCTMHHHLHHQFNRQLGPVNRLSDLPSYLNWLPQVCSDQDDRWIETLLCTLDIYLHARQICTEAGNAKMLIKLLAPHGLFIQMLYLTHFNASLLIDWLTSPETCFLAYLMRYLRLVAADFPKFCLAAATWNPVFPSQSSSAVFDGCQSMDEVQTKKSDYVRVHPEQNRNEVPMSGSEFSDLVQTLVAQPKRSRSPLRKASGPLNQCERSDSCSHSDCFPDLAAAGSENSGSQTYRQDNVTSTQSNRAITSENIIHPSLGLALLSGYDDGSDDSSGESCDEREPLYQSSMDDAKLVSRELDEERRSATAAPSKSGVDHEEAVSIENTAVNIHSDQEHCDADYSDDDGQDDDDNGYDDYDDDGDANSDGNDHLCDIAAQTELADKANPSEQVSNLTPHSLQSDSSANLDWHQTETSNSSVTPMQVKQKHIPRRSQSKKRDVSNLRRGETRKDSEEGYVSRVMHLLIAVRERLQRLHGGGLLVYNPSPLVSLIQRCEGLYHSMYSE